MKPSVIAFATVLSLMVGYAGTAAATTVSFPPDISAPDTDSGTTSSDRNGSGAKYK